MMHQRLRMNHFGVAATWSVAALAAALGSACGGENGEDGGSDAGSGVDAGPRADAGPQWDGGTGEVDEMEVGPEGGAVTLFQGGIRRRGGRARERGKVTASGLCR